MLLFVTALLVSQASSEAASEPATAPVPVTVAATPPKSDEGTRQALLMFAAGAGAAIVSVPATVALGTWLGSLSSNLVGALLPSILLLAVIPPLAITAAAWLVGDMVSKGSVRFGPALGVAVGLQVVGIVVAALTGVSSGNVGSMVGYTVGEAIVLPLGVTLTMALGRKSTPPPAVFVPRDAFEQYSQARTPMLTVGF